MNGALCCLEDWAQTQDFLKSLGLSRAHLKRHLTSLELKRPLRSKQETAFSLNILNHNLISPEVSVSDPKVLFENDDFLVLHKPAQVHGHALNYLETDNMLSWLRANGYGKLLQVGANTHERGLLYRLDHVTSGVLIYVKYESLWQELRQNFHKVAHLKRYVAIVDKTPEQTGELSAWFDLSGKKVKAFLNPHAQAVEGTLFLRILKEDERGVALAIDLAHGHRHQIRAHLVALGCPIRGDNLYGGTQANRLFLHAYMYQLEKRLSACDTELGFGQDFLDLHSDLKMLGNHSGIIHGS